MTAKIVEGLSGSFSSLKLSETPTRRFLQASFQNDSKGMDRALNYAKKTNQMIISYQAETLNGLKEANEEAREQNKNRINELQESRHAEKQVQAEKASAGTQVQKGGLDASGKGHQLSAAMPKAQHPSSFDRVEISNEGKEWLKAHNSEKGHEKGVQAHQAHNQSIGSSLSSMEKAGRVSSKSNLSTGNNVSNASSALSLKDNSKMKSITQNSSNNSHTSNPSSNAVVLTAGTRIASQMSKLYKAS